MIGGKSIKIGDVYVMQFSGSGSEQTGKRPGLVFQNNTGNLHSPNIIALPLTSALKKAAQPTHVLIPSSGTGLKVDSMVLCENPERVSKENVGAYITTLSPKHMEEVAIAFLLATSAIAYVEPRELLEAWYKAVKLNAVAA